MYIEEKASGESLDGFIEFCSRKDPNESYMWTNSHECACGQYLKSIGQFNPNWVGSSDTMGVLNRIAGGSIDPDSWHTEGYRESDWTFGKCVERAKRVKELA